MGQHKFNPNALAAKRGDLDPGNRVRPAAVGSSFGGAVSATDYYMTAERSIRLTRPKLRGKARVKRAKKARRVARNHRSSA